MENLHLEAALEHMGFGYHRRGDHIDAYSAYEAAAGKCVEYY